MELLLPEERRKPCTIWDDEVPIVKIDKTYHAYISNGLGEPYAYDKLCHILLNVADKKTTFNIHLNTPGGLIDSAVKICDAITNTKATVIVHLTGTVASAGTMIAMCANDLIVSEHLAFMVHNYSSGLQGKGGELKVQQKFMDKQLNNAFKTLYKGFLTTKEIKEVIDDKDMWMDAKEVRERWSKKKGTS